MFRLIVYDGLRVAIGRALLAPLDINHDVVVGLAVEWLSCTNHFFVRHD